MKDSTEHRELLDRLGAIDVQQGIILTKIDGLHETSRAVKEDLKNHETMDRWIQGSILTILLVILTKLFVH